MRTHLIFLLLLFVACNSEEKASLEAVISQYNEVKMWSGGDYNSYTNKLKTAKNDILEHIAKYPYSKSESLLFKYAANLEEQEKSILKEQTAYERMISKRQSNASLADIIQETSEIQRFMETYPNNIQKTELQNRLTVLSTMKDDVFLDEMNKELTTLWGKMDLAASSKADEIHPLSVTNSFTVSSNEKPNITGPGNYSCKRVYQIAMSGIGWGHSNVVIAVEGQIRGDVKNGITSQVSAVSVMQRE